VDDFEVDWKIETNDLFDTVQSSNNLNYFTVDGLQVGRLYHFRVRARNDVGLSLETPTAIFMAARVPDQPAAPTKLAAEQTFISI
jgi:hypothetical protein